MKLAHRVISLLVVLGAQVASAQVASAQPTPTGRERAAELNRQAEIAYEQGDYRQAAQILEFAYQAYPEPDVLYNLGRARELAGEVDAAIAAYRRYLEAAPKATDREQVRILIGKLEAKARSAPDPAPPIDPKPATEGPPAKPAAAPVVVIKRPSPRVAPTPVPDESGTPQRPTGAAPRVLGIATASVGGAVLGVATFFAIRASSRESDLEECAARQVNQCPKSQVESLQDGANDATKARWLIGVGSAAVIGGVVLYYLGRTQGASDSQLSVTGAGAGADGVALEWRGAF